MELINIIRNFWYRLAPAVYKIASKRELVKLYDLFDTPTMTRYHHVVAALRYIAVEEYFGQNSFGKSLYIKANHWEGMIW